MFARYLCRTPNKEERWERGLLVHVPRTLLDCAVSWEVPNRRLTVYATGIHVKDAIRHSKDAQDGNGRGRLEGVMRTGIQKCVQ